MHYRNNQFSKTLYHEYKCILDSIFLMNATREMMKLEGVRDAVLVMGSDMNKTVLVEFGASSSEIGSATPNDLIISLDGDRTGVISDAQALMESLLKQKGGEKGEGNTTYPTLDLALNNSPDVNLVYISVPGEYAGLEARLALDQGKNVFIFSDNVPLEEEVELKQLAREKGLWVMGPGCGTSVLGGISVGMMSKIGKGPVGIVGASGSGIHEIAALLDRAGSGVTQAIGTGGRDLSKEVGAITMIQGLTYLMGDDDTKVIVLVSKPPHPDSAEKIFSFLENASKPAVVYFLGRNLPTPKGKNIVMASTLEDAARKALEFSRGGMPNGGDPIAEIRKTLSPEAAAIAEKLRPEQKYLRGLFCGGTHCEEAILLLKDLLGEVHSNIAFGGSVLLKDAKKSAGNCLVDMGDEEFTLGKPHPVMEPSILNDRLLQEAEDPEVGAILFDLLLGYGAHKNPAGTISETLSEIRKKLEAAGRHLCITATLTGTDRDPQGFEEQKQQLKALGVHVLPSNAQASLLAGLVVSGRDKRA
jgi:succinyl-CoA synthetase alpha subunit